MSTIGAGLLALFVYGVVLSTAYVIGRRSLL